MKLNITGNDIGNEGAAALGSLLIDMNTLKSLHMNGMSDSDDEPANITAQGWLALFNSLQGSNLDLVKLDLSGNTIDDEGLQLLVQLVSNMSSLKDLRLSYNYSVTPTGWLALSDYLQSPNFELRELDLNCNNLNDDTVIAFTSALSHNKILERLYIYDEAESLTERGWKAVSSLLSNNSSIMNTYNSNHTLHKLIEDDVDEYLNLKLTYDLSQGIKSLLKLNKNKDKVEVARQKILQTHFSTEDDTSKLEELLDMELEVVPTAVEWIGRPTNDDWIGKSMSGLSFMFNLMRSLPDLFDSNPEKKPYCLEEVVRSH